MRTPKTLGLALTILSIYHVALVKTHYVNKSSLNFDGECGGRLTGHRGTIESPGFESPGFPKRYFNNLDCFWFIEVPLGKLINIEITFMQIEYHRTCIYDALFIRDGSNIKSRPIGGLPTTGRICGFLPDEGIHLKTTGSEALIHFRTDYINTYRGFKIKWTETTDPCPPRPKCPQVNRLKNGTEWNWTCTWVDASEYSCYTKEGVHWNEKAKSQNILCNNLENCTQAGGDCYQHVVNCPKGMKKIEGGCGEETCTCCASVQCDPCPVCQNKTCPEVKCSHMRDNSEFEIPAQARHRPHRPNQAKTPCGENFNSESGRLQSPGYDNDTNYFNNLDCFWTITVEKGKRIKIKMIDMEVEHQRHCHHDAIIFRDGNSPRSKRIGSKICGGLNPKKPLIRASTGNTIFIHFRTDYINVYKGFLLEWTSEPIRKCPPPPSCLPDQYSGPYDKIWSNKQCKNEGNMGAKSLSECISLCIKHPKCTAVNYKGGAKPDCVLRGCILPVPAPEATYPPYKGYSINAEDPCGCSPCPLNATCPPIVPCRSPNVTDELHERNVARFTRGSKENNICWNIDGVDGFYSVIDGHNQFRPFRGPAVPFNDYLGWLIDSGIVFSTNFGGQVIKKRNPDDPNCCHYLHCPNLNYTLIPDPVSDTINAQNMNIYMKDVEMQKKLHLSLSIASLNLQNPVDNLNTFDRLTSTFPKAFSWIGEINVFKHDLAANGFFHVPQLTVDKVRSGYLDEFFLKMERIKWPLTMHCDLGCDRNDSTCRVSESEIHSAKGTWQFWKEMLGTYYELFFDWNNSPKENFKKIQHLHVWDSILRRFPDLKVVWTNMGLSEDLITLHPIIHRHIVNKLFERHPLLYVDLSSVFLVKHLFMNYNNETIDMLVSGHFGKVHIHVNVVKEFDQKRDSLHKTFLKYKDQLHVNGSAEFLTGPTYALAIYLETINKYPEHFLTGTGFVASMGKPDEYPGLQTSPTDCIKNKTNYAQHVADTSSINIFLQGETFRKIVLGENYFKLTGMEDKYAAPRLC